MPHPLNRIVTPMSKYVMIRQHAPGVNQSLRGRPGATVIIPVGMMDKSELKEHIAIANEENKGRAPIKIEQVEEATEKRIKGTHGPPSVANLLRSGKRPPPLSKGDKEWLSHNISR